MFESSSSDDRLRDSNPVRRIRIPFVFAVAAGLFISGIVSEPAGAITKSEVEAVCSGSREAYETYQAARSAFLTASEQLEQANGILVRPRPRSSVSGASTSPTGGPVMNSSRSSKLRP